MFIFTSWAAQFRCQGRGYAGYIFKAVAHVLAQDENYRKLTEIREL